MEPVPGILESIPVVFFALNPAWEFTYVNAEGARILQRPTEELIGKTIWQECPELSGSDLEAVYREAMEKRIQCQITYYDPKHASWYEVYAYPSPTGITVCFHDASNAKKTEQQREQQVLELQQRIRLFDSTFASAQDFIYILDANARFRYVNKALLDLWGMLLEDAIGKDFFDLKYPDELAQRLADQVAEVFRTKRPLTGETPYTSPTGEEGHFEYIFSPILKENGEVEAIAGTTRDITTRKQGEDRLREAIRRSDAALLAGEVGTYYWDIISDRLSGDRNFQQMFGVLHDEKASAPVASFIEVIHPDDQQRVAEQIQQTLTTDAQFQSEYRIRHPAGEKWVIARGVVRRDKDGQPLGWAGVIVDISGRKQAEQERESLLEREREARSEAERAGRMKDEFLATLSHEIRTPLNAILGWAQILRTSADPEDLATGLETIERNARSQSQIIEDLLDMSRIISGKVRLNIQHADLAAIVRAAVETVRPSSEAKGVNLNIIMGALIGVTIAGDINRLQQVFWNLLTNAVKFTPRGGRIEVVLERVNAHLEVRVTDSGEGIEPQFLPFVFDRFRQADASTTRRHGGLGLGLSIVKQLVELHGGSIRARSAGGGRGATFIVSLPLNELHAEVPGEPEGRRWRSGRVLSLENDASGKIAGVRVLVVDDELDARLLVKRLLEECDAKVTIAASAQEAFDALTKSRFDILVSDIGMPNEDGYSLMRRVRALEKVQGGNMPAIALTAYARAEDRMKAESAGFLMHIAKPIEPIELITMVAAATGKTG